MYMYVCTCVCIYMYVYVYIYIYIYIYEGYRDSPGPTPMLGWSVGGERAAGENF